MAAIFQLPTEIWVVDTSSIIQVRRDVPRKHQRRVFAALTRLTKAGVLTFPRAVLDELDRHHDPHATIADLPYQWAFDNKEEATRIECSLEDLKGVLAKVPDVLDPDRTGIEEADHHVLALAQLLQRRGASASIVTEDRSDKPTKLSLTTAAGILQLPVVPLHAFLRIHGIEVDI